MSTFQMPKMEVSKSNGSFCNFYPTLPNTFCILKMSKQAPFKYPKWRLSSQINGGAFVKIITRKLKKMKFRSYVTPDF